MGEVQNLPPEQVPVQILKDLEQAEEQLNQLFRQLQIQKEQKRTTPQAAVKEQSVSKIVPHFGTKTLQGTWTCCGQPVQFMDTVGCLFRGC